MRLAVDTGGTFTDLVVDDGSGGLKLFKAPTTPADPVEGVLDVLRVAADAMGLTLADLLADADLTFGTTRAINAILTGTTAKTAAFVTAGHPDILVFREGGRTNPFDFTGEYPAAYIPRARTFEVPERIGPAGQILTPLDETRTLEIIAGLDREVEAIAVCLLWSIANPAHELRVGELIEEQRPGVAFTLSHELNPAIREYRRASSAAIDASLKPIMSEHLSNLDRRLREAGFRGTLFTVTSTGGLMASEHVAERPIHAINSGPAMAPVAGRHYARRAGRGETVIVADTGGTSYDLSVVSRGVITRTRETWLGGPYRGHMTGFPSVDVRSIGAGGGSLAWVDSGGLPHVGPRSAGSVPGPACYGRGGERATLTDASLLLGYLDPDFFLGGAMQLDREAAAAAVRRDVAEPLGRELPEASAAVLTVATELMVTAIEAITLHEGIDPRAAVLVAGGGAAGLNAVMIARRLGCGTIVIPDTTATLSAVGGLISDLVSEFAVTAPMSTVRFDRDAANQALAELRRRCDEFAASVPGLEVQVDLMAEARYPNQVWELEVPLALTEFTANGDDTAKLDRQLEDFEEAFHQAHEQVFAVRDPGSPVEIVAWRARAAAQIGRGTLDRVAATSTEESDETTRNVHFPGWGDHPALVRHLSGLDDGETIAGPAIIESPVTTIVLDPASSAKLDPSGSLVVEVEAGAAPESVRELDHGRA